MRLGPIALFDPFSSINSPTWEDLGVPTQVVPAPPPFLPIPKGLVMKMEGLDTWSVLGLRGNRMEEVGKVFAEDESEAFDAADNKYGGNGYRALKVVRS